MPTKRGWAAVAAGLALWVASRLIGSSDLHMAAVGILALPVLAALFVRLNQVQLEVTRHLSAVRVFPGSRVTVSLTIANEGRLSTPFLLLEDALPASLGRPARLVVAGIPPRNQQVVSYPVTCRQRGRFQIGPLSIFVGDPFGLARVRMQTSSQNDLIVYPEVENLEGRSLATQGAGAGESAVRHLYRSAAEFYTMREYVTGDDLRRIHWPSVARTGQLMIRQDESTRRSTATLFLDNRGEALGAYGAPGFERAVSVAATLGVTLSRAGFAVTMGSTDARPRHLSEEQLLEALAGIAPARIRTMSESLRNLRASALADSTLAMVCAPPTAGEVASLARVGTAFGRRLIVMVYPAGPSTLQPEVATELEARASTARVSLQRAGWTVHLVRPDGRLADSWQLRRTRKLQPAGLSS